MSKKEYPATVAALWKRGFQFSSMTIDARAFDQIRDTLAKAEIGGQLVLRTTAPKTKQEKGEKFPDAFLEYLTPAQVEQAKKDYEDYRAKQGQSL